MVDGTFDAWNPVNQRKKTLDHFPINNYQDFNLLPSWPVGSTNCTRLFVNVWKMLYIHKLHVCNHRLIHKIYMWQFMTSVISGNPSFRCFFPLGPCRSKSCGSNWPIWAVRSSHGFWCFVVRFWRRKNEDLLTWKTQIPVIPCVKNIFDPQQNWPSFFPGQIFHTFRGQIRRTESVSR